MVHAEAQKHHIESVVVEGHGNKSHREEDVQEAHEIDMIQNVAVADPNEAHYHYCDDPTVSDLAVDHVLEEEVHESCSTAVKRDNILQKSESKRHSVRRASIEINHHLHKTKANLP